MSLSGWTYYKTFPLTAGGSTAGTIAVTNGSATVTGTGTDFKDWLVGDKIQLPDDNWYTISAIASATSLTISENYPGTTASGETYDCKHINYQMKLVVHRSTGTDSAGNVYIGTKCEEDYDDIRFTTSDSETLLDYWIEASDSSEATVWIESAEIGTSATTFYLYYGNAGAAAYSNIEDTFIFGDDFEDGSIDTARWVKEKTGNSDFAEQNGRLEVIYGSPDSDLNLNLKSQNTFSPEGKAYQCKARAGAAHVSGTQLTLYNSSEVSVYRALLMHEGGYDNFRADRYQGSFTVLYQASWISNIQTLEIRYPAGGDIEFYEGSIKRANESYRLAAGAINIRLTARVVSSLSGLGTDYFEYAFIRKYVSPEPVWGTWGSEEEAATSASVAKFNAIPKASIAKINGIPIANIKSINGINLEAT